MAFSTQKEFFHVPFMNETVDYECRRACVKLKTYQSTVDDRSWAMDETLQSRFLSDLITCQTPVGAFGDFNGDDDDYSGFGSDRAGTSSGAPTGRSGQSAPRGAGRGGGRGAGQGGGGRGAGQGGGGRGGPDGRTGPAYDKIVDDTGYADGAGMGADLLGAPSSGYGRGGGAAGAGGPDGGGLGASGSSKGGRGGGGPGGGGPGGSKGGGMGGGGGGGRSGHGGLVAADSVIACATEHLGRFEELLSHKKNLEKKLEVSNERLKVVNMENEKIKAIMNDKFDSNHAKDFYNKIQKLTSSGKISKGEENELLQIYNKFETMNKAYEILQAENAYLKCLMEKLSSRASYEAIKMEPEKSTDIGFLQKEVNKLRQEVSMLRKFEDEKLKASLDSNRNKMTDQDAETLKAIVKERNALREKCKSIKDLEGKMDELQRIAREADKMSDTLSSHLDKESRRIAEMENEMKDMQDYYEEQISKLRFNEDLLKCQLDAMKEDLIRATCAAQKADLLEMENSCLRNELVRRDNRLSEYDCQYKQLMKVIDELQGNAIQNLHDTQTQTCTDYMDDLTFFARATLSEIKKELKKRGGADGDKIGGGFFGGAAITDGSSPDECCAELRRMQDVVRKLTLENEYLQNSTKNAAEELCADTLKKLKELEEKYKKANDEIVNLKKEKDELNMKSMQKLNEFSERVNKLDVDVSRTAKDTSGMDKDLKESIKLVQDISDIQLKNAQLTNAVNEISTRDDQRALDDLRRQLLEEQAKNKQCQEDNKKLKEELVKRGIDAEKAIKELVKQEPMDGPPAVRDGPADTAVKKRATFTPEAGGLEAAKKGGAGPAETTVPEAAKKGGADAAETGGASDVAKKAETGPGATKAGEPDAGKKTETGPGATKPGAADAAKKDGPGASDAPKKDKTGPGAADAKKDGPATTDAAKKGEPDAAKKGQPDAAKKGQPDDAKKAEPDAAKKGEPDVAKKGEPDPAKKGEPDAAKKGEPDSARKDAPGASQPGGPDAAKKDGPVAPAAAKKDEPGAAGVPDAAKRDEPGAGPGADKRDEPGAVFDAGETGESDTAKRGETGAEFGGVGGDGERSDAPDGTRDDAERDGLDKAGRAEDGVNVVGRNAGDRTGTGKVGAGAVRTGPGAAGGPGAAKRGGPVSGVSKMHGAKDADGPADDAFQQFVDTNANAMMTNIKAGSALEKELRVILNAFMMECGFCFCKSLVPKSKFYALCHKLLHSGIQCMAFRELAYMHRKIFMAADKLHPGCLLNMILTEQGFKDGENFKCCYCKNALCCSNSEEMLKKKVCKLERDIEMAKEYLDSLKTQPKTPKSPYTTRGKTYRQMEDSYSEAVEELLTCREAKPALSKSHSKQMKTLKARIIKCSELLR